MQTTATFDAIVTLVQRRNALLDERDNVRQELRGSLSEQRRVELNIEFWHTVGIIDGIGQALEALREAGEHVGSAEYFVIYEAQNGVRPKDPARL